MPNYIDYITLENTYLDTWYDLLDNWNSYELEIDFQFNWTEPWTIFKWSGDAFSAYSIDWEIHYYEWFYKNWHMVYSDPTIRRNYVIEESYELLEQRKWTWKFTNSTFSWFCDDIYNNNYNQKRSRWRLLIWSRENQGTVNVWEIKLTVDWVVVLDMKPCINSKGVEFFYDEIRQRSFYPDWYGVSDSMIKTVIMSWNRQMLPINDGIEKIKIENSNIQRITEPNRFDNWYAAKYDEISISADEDNIEWILISDYTENQQVNEAGVADWIELKPRWTLILPRNKQIAALNRPFAKGHKWDMLRIVVR